MSLTIRQAREQLELKISEAKESKAGKYKKKDSCEHEWKRYKQRVYVDNEKYTGDPNVVMILLACNKCKRKVYTDLRIGN